MTTQTLIDILANRIKARQSNPTEAQLLSEVIMALARLQQYESGHISEEDSNYAAYIGSIKQNGDGTFSIDE